MSTFCSCWVESFDLLGDTVNPYWKQQVFADSRESASKSPLLAHIFGYSNDGWTPYTVDSSNWFAVRFNTLKVVTGIAMAGHKTEDEFIKTYHVKWSHTGYDYTFNYYLGLDANPKVSYFFRCLSLLMSFFNFSSLPGQLFTMSQYNNHFVHQ